MKKENSAKGAIGKVWDYLKKDTWDSWIVSIILVFILIKFVFFPSMSLITGTPLPMVIVESCSMYHGTNFEEWWSRNAVWYESRGINKSEFESYPFHNGLNKGDIILAWGHSDYQKGDIIIFSAPTQYPLIHRLISNQSLSTKGDHNLDQLDFEKEISQNQLIGKSAFRIPLLGWIKLVFFEPFRAPEQRGLCK